MKLLGIVILLSSLSLRIEDVTATSAQESNPKNSNRLPIQRIERLVSQLNDKSFQTREQATHELVNYGPRLLPILRKAVSKNDGLEVKLRLERVINRIESEHRPKLLVKSILVKLLNGKSSVSNERVISALYILGFARLPTQTELEQVHRLLQNSDDQNEAADVLMNTVWTNSEFDSSLADIHQQFTDVKKLILAHRTQHRMIDEKYLSRFMSRVTAQFTKAKNNLTRSQAVDAQFLIVLSRFPTDKECKRIEEYLNQRGRRKLAEDLFWALMHTNEFLFAN